MSPPTITSSTTDFVSRGDIISNVTAMKIAVTARKYRSLFSHTYVDIFFILILTPLSGPAAHYAEPYCLLYFMSK